MKLGLLAKDIHNSVLPITYSTYGQDLGIEVDFNITNIPEEGLSGTVEQLKKNLSGFTVTMPYKKAIMPFLSSIDDSAENCGSCNCCLVRDGELIGYNTDGWGFIKDLSLKNFDVKDKTVIMVGAGGVATSIAYNLKINNVKRIIVFNVIKPELDQLYEKIGKPVEPHMFSYDEIKEACKDADLFINASILGQVGYPEYEDLSFLDVLKRDAIVYDVNYSKKEALLPNKAKEKGLKAYVGSAMSALQGIRAMEIWTGHKPSDKCAIELVSKLQKG